MTSETRQSAFSSAGSVDEVTQVQDIGPPEWRSVLNFSHDFGYPDFFPSRPGFHQPEDVVTGINVRQGFQGVNVVAAGVESVSVHAAISDRLKKANISKNVNALAIEILNARRDRAPVFPESVYKLPNRVVYNESMKKSFLNDLSDESIPLDSPKFAKSVPHGMKGLDLLEMLWSRRIQVDRAIWLIHILGAHQVQNLRRGYDRSKSPFSPNQQYSTLFTESLTTFLNKQVGELQSIYDKMIVVDGIKREDVSRKEIWVAKWEYTQTLLQALIHGNLLDVRSFGMWINDGLHSIRLTMLPLILDHLERVASLIFEDKVCGVCIVTSLIRKLDEVMAHPVRTALQAVELRMMTLIRLAWHQDQVLFFLPESWAKHRNVLRKVLGITSARDPQPLIFVERRSLRVLYHRTKPEFGATASEELRKVSLARLKSLANNDGTADLRNLCAHYFLSSDSEDITPETLRGKLAILLDWGVKQNRLQPHRPYLVAKLLKFLLLLPGIAKVVNSAWLASYLMAWTDNSAYTAVGHSALAVQTLVAELFNNMLISFKVYLERMIAAGKTYRQSNGSQQLCQYLDFIAQLQVVGLSESVTTLRENVIYGFSRSASCVSDYDGIHRAMKTYLDQSSGISDTATLYERAVPPVPDILLEKRSPALDVECRKQIDCLHSLSSSIPPLELTLRLSLLIHLFELQRNYRALSYISAKCLDMTERTTAKPVQDTIRRHRLLFTSLGDEFPELALTAQHLGQSEEPFSSSLLSEKRDAVQRQIQRMQPHLSIVDGQALETLHEASLNSQSIERLSTLWMMALELASGLRSLETSNQTISLVAGIWTAITQSSTTVWDMLLRRWVVDADPTSPLFLGTAALCIELMLRGSLDTAVLWNKLIYPVISTPKLMYSNTSHLQPLVSLCFRLLPTDDTVFGCVRDLLVVSAVKAGFAKMSDTTSLISDFLQRLPFICLLLKDDRGMESTRSVYKVVATSQLQSVATKHSSIVKAAFASAISQLPEMRAFFESVLRILLAHPQEASSTSPFARTDWRSLVTIAPSASTWSPSPVAAPLTASDAKNVVTAAAQLLSDGSESTWWQMCASMTTHILSALHIAACQLVHDLLHYEGGPTIDDMRRIEQYLTTLEISRSCSLDLESLSVADSIGNTPWEELDKLLSQLENSVLRLPSELYARLLSMITSIICMAKTRIALGSEIQLRVLKSMEMSRDLPAAFKTDMVLLHFQLIRADKRSQLALWLAEHQQGKTLDTYASLSVMSGSRDDEWETLPITEEAHSDCLPHRAAFTRLTVPSNKGSMSLLQFGARLTGDRVAQPVVDADDDTMESTESSPWTHFVSERDIGTGPTGESVYQRNLASGLSAPDSGDTAGLNPPGAVKEMEDVDYEMITDSWVAPPANVDGTAEGQVDKPSRPLPRKRVKVVDFQTS